MELLWLGRSRLNWVSSATEPAGSVPARQVAPSTSLNTTRSLYHFCWLMPCLFFMFALSANYTDASQCAGTPGSSVHQTRYNPMSLLFSWLMLCLFMLLFISMFMFIFVLARQVARHQSQYNFVPLSLLFGWLMLCLFFLLLISMFMFIFVPARQVAPSTRFDTTQSPCYYCSFWLMLCLFVVVYSLLVVLHHRPPSTSLDIRRSPYYHCSVVFVVFHVFVYLLGRLFFCLFCLLF